MNTKTMEGLIGARTNMELTNTPMRVFKEARLKGDTAAMERAMGYVGDFSDKAQEYKVKADQGMEEEAEETREKAEAEREEAIRKRREERDKLEERIEEGGNKEGGNEDINADTVEISEEGKVLLKNNAGLENTEYEAENADIIKKPVTYTKTGETVPEKPVAGISVSV